MCVLPSGRLSTRAVLWVVISALPLCSHLGAQGISPKDATANKEKPAALSLPFSIGDDGIAELAGLKNLVELNLAYCQITDRGLQAVGQMEHLRTLSLPGTKVTDAGLSHLKGLKQLRVLHLMDTRVTNSAVNELKVNLPKVKVFGVKGVDD